MKPRQTLKASRHLFIVLTFSLMGLLTGCVDTQIKLDLREPQLSVVDLQARLQPAALDMLKISNPSLLHGNWEEPAKQTKACQAFMGNDPRAQALFSSQGPVEREGVRVSKRVEYDGVNLHCGFMAEGPAQRVLKMIGQAEMIQVTEANERYRIRLNTRESDFGNVPDFGFLGLGNKPENTPTLHVTVRGHDLKTNFEAGLVNATEFELTENLLGKRQHFQTEFEVSVSSQPPSLLDRLFAWFNEIWMWAKAQIDSMAAGLY